MAPRAIVDSHVHLWPASMAEEEHHRWMTPDTPLAREHGLAEYWKAATRAVLPHDAPSHPSVEGIVFIETDVRYDSTRGDPRIWAKGQLREIEFLRGMVEGWDGERAGRLLLGVVPWAPVDQPTGVLERWLGLVEATAGAETWRRVRGFRFLLQAITTPGEFHRLVGSEEFVANLRLLGRRGFAFDVGVDQRSVGVWQLEAVAGAMERVHEGVPEGDRVVFIINHLCKPDYEAEAEEFGKWKEVVERMSRLSRTYMKLSGGFSELPEDIIATNDAGAMAAHLRPWTDHVLSCFGPSRTMFGSDWPVCNVRGPTGCEPWTSWKDVVTLAIDGKFSDEERDRIWRTTARDAYGLE